MRKFTIFFLLVLVYFYSLNAQLPTYGWRDHFDFHRIYSICQTSQGNILGASDNGVLIIYPDGSMDKLTKLNGLSDFGVHSVAYSNQFEKTIIGYKNGNIDIIDNNQIYNIPDIKLKNIAVDKTINKIIISDKYAYLACGFGIAILDIDKNEIFATAFIGENAGYVDVKNIAFRNDSIFAATSDGLLVALLNDDIVDYNNWVNYEIPGYSGLTDIAILDSNIFVIAYNGSSYDLLKKNNNTWSIVKSNLNSNANLKSYDKIYLNSKDNFYIISKNGTITDTSHFEYFNTNDFLISDGKYYFAENTAGIEKLSDNKFTSFVYQGVYLNQPFKIKNYGNKIYVTRGAYTLNHNNLWRAGTINIYDLQQNTWKTKINWQGLDYNVIAIDTTDENHYFIGAWWKGIYEYDSTTVTNEYNVDNSPLESLLSSPGYVRVSGLVFDKDLNLWSLNNAYNRPLNVLKKDGTWKTFNLPTLTQKKTGEMIFTKNGVLWGILLDDGFFALDDNQTLEDENDDIFKIIKPYDDNGELIGTKYFCLAQDKNGDIWFGTNDGVGVFYSPENFNTDGYHATRIKITDILNDSLVTNYLLAGQNVISIAIDGGNRKWFGTNGDGVYLLNEDGTEQLAHYTTDNSPLPSNIINSIAIVPQTGEVFFATANGVVSFMSDAAEAGNEFSNVYVYPNPVREDYDGPITITGLLYDTNVKITDVAGNIVYETTSNGDKAIWNGTNFDGKRVATGIYLVFCTTPDGKKTFVTKLLFIN